MPDLPYFLLMSDQQHSPSETLSWLINLAEQQGFSIGDTVPEKAELVLEFKDDRLQLREASEPGSTGVKVDFLSGQSQYRRQHGGGAKESIAKAIGIKRNQPFTVLDATPGLGRDAFVLAALGANMLLVERSAVAFLLLSDGLRRLSLEEPELAAQFSLHCANSCEFMLQQAANSVDAVYLDPMFPHRKKSAQVKKEMRLFQLLLGPDEDADLLLPAALHAAAKRVVVKRPNTAPVLADKKPSMAITSKKHRFDVYIKN